MFMQSGDARAAIFHSVLTGGIVMSALSSMVKSSFAMNALLISG